MSSQEDNPGRIETDVSSIWMSLIDDVRDAYVLDTLDERDRGTVRVVLARFPETAAEVDAEASALALIGLIAQDAGAPSPAVRDRLFTRLSMDQTFQRAQDGEPLPLSPASDPSTFLDSGGTIGATRSWTRFIPPALSGPLAIAVVVLIAWSSSLQNQLDRAESDLATGQITSTSSVGQIQLYSMEPMCTGCEGNGRVGIDLADSVGMVLAWNLDPDDDQEVWCVNSKGDKERVTQLDVNADGGAMQMFNLPQDGDQYTQVYLQNKDGTVTYMSEVSPTESPEASPPPG